MRHLSGKQFEQLATKGKKWTNGNTKKLNKLAAYTTMFGEAVVAIQLRGLQALVSTMLGLKPEPLLPWDGVLLVVDRLLEDPFDFSTELGIYRLIFDMQLAQCCMPIPRTQKGKPTMASQPWPASADLSRSWTHTT